MLRNLSLRTRLTVATVGIFLVVYAVVAAVLYAQQVRTSWDQVDSDLEEVLGFYEVVPELGELPVDEIPEFAPEDFSSPFGDFGAADPFGPGGFAPIVQYLDARGDVERRSGPALPIDATTRAIATGDDTEVPHFANDRVDRTEYRIGAVPIDGGGAVQTAVEVDDVAEFLRRLRGGLFVGGLVAAVVVAGLSLLMVTFTLRPLERMRETAEVISVTEDPAVEVAGADKRDEAGRLARAFNLMLRRLSASRERSHAALEAQRRFVADASHDLRTPLTTIRGNIDVLLRHPDLDEPERTAALREASQEATRLSRLAEDLLTLARSEDLEPQAGVVSPAEIARDTAAAARRREAAAGRNVTVTDRAGGTRAMGDPEALRRALDALCDNAFVHGEGDVTMTIDPPEQGWIRVTVSDAGPGIPPAEREAVFERLFRGESAASRPGTGLGLAITRSLIEAAGGRVDATDTGIVVTLRAASAPGHRE